jgi:formamidopyrimidine-DNA glycosylase
MPEFPDLSIYLDRLAARAKGRELERLRIGSPFVLRTVEPKADAFAGKKLVALSRIGKRLVFRFEGDLFAVIHLMILGRLHWKGRGAKIPRGGGLAAFDFATGTLLFVEHGKKRRASLHLVRGEAELAQFRRGGIEVFESTEAQFAEALQRKNLTLKRALTDPTIVAAVGNAYSDEILHRAKLSPFKQTQSLSGEEIQRLFKATRGVLEDWTRWLGEQVGEGWPGKVTAFHPGMAVHGRYKQPCPVCGAPVQRIVYADNEANYCARCQTEGRILADRALSRLLKASWPRTLEEIEG